MRNKLKNYLIAILFNEHFIIKITIVKMRLIRDEYVLFYLTFKIQHYS